MTTSVHAGVVCSSCHREWPADSQQAAMMAKHGTCFLLPITEYTELPNSDEVTIPVTMRDIGERGQLRIGGKLLSDRLLVSAIRGAISLALAQGQ